MRITDALFGLRGDIFFWVPGEPYIRRERERDPIVQKFFIPACVRVGYKHRIDIEDGRWVIRDSADYEVVVVVTFDVEMGRAPMSITLCIPYSMIEPIRAKLNAGFQSDQNEVDTTWLNRLRLNLEMAKVDMSVELGQAEISVRDFLNLKLGDIIPLEQEVEQPLNVTVEGITKFKGYQGSYKGHQAVKVTELTYNPPVLDEILLL